MSRRLSRGKCLFCQNSFNKGGIVNHLKACKERKAASGLLDKDRSRSTSIFHLMIEGRYLPDYWMHIELPANATLADLDRFLRDVWLECCGHLSAFTIQGKSYSSYPQEFDAGGLRFRLSDVLHPGMKFTYVYDFGSSTELALKVVAEREGVLRNNIQLLVRNDPPFIPCDSCGQKATQVCTECLWEGGGWMCNNCAEEHECDEEMFLPVVNSPRLGVCGYTGD